MFPVHRMSVFLLGIPCYCQYFVMADYCLTVHEVTCLMFIIDSKIFAYFNVQTSLRQMKSTDEDLKCLQPLARMHFMIRLSISLPVLDTSIDL